MTGHVLRNAALSLLLLAGGVWSLWLATDGFEAFTTQSAHAVQVSRQPRPLPSVQLQDQSGDEWALDELTGKWLVVDFMYTRCTTLCSVMGSRFAQLQKQLQEPMLAGQVGLLSISFDPASDPPAALAGYLERFGARTPGWQAVRPSSRQALDRLQQVFGITVIPDGLGGYLHNDGFGLVSPDGQLVSIMREDSSVETVAAAVRTRLSGQPRS